MSSNVPPLIRRYSSHGTGGIVGVSYLESSQKTAEWLWKCTWLLDLFSRKGFVLYDVRTKFLSPASRLASRGSTPCLSLWNFWWAKWHCYSCFFVYLGRLLSVTFRQCSTLLTYLLTDLLTCLLTYLLTCLLTYLLTYLLAYILTCLFTYILTYLVAYILTCLIICLLT